MRHRIDLLARWTGWANELAREITPLVSRPSGRGCIFGEEAAAIGSHCPIDGLARCPSSFDDLKQGFSPVGSAPVTGVFKPSFKPAEFTEEELDKRAKFLRPALWAKIAFGQF